MADIKLGIKILLGFVITTLVVCNYSPDNHLEILAIASPLATVAGILFGVVIASVTFFSSVKDNHLIEALKATKMYDVLLRQLGLTGAFLIVSCICMVVSIFSPFKKIIDSHAMTYDYWLLIIGFFFLVVSLLEFRSGWAKIQDVIKNM
ncbi:MAG: hypothetical protein ACRDD9_21935 [Shewanella sp.]